MENNFEKLTGAARDKHVAGFAAYTSTQNRAMARLLNTMPYKIHTRHRKLKHRSSYQSIVPPKGIVNNRMLQVSHSHERKAKRQPAATRLMLSDEV